MNGRCQVNSLVVRRFAPSNQRMKSAARCCRREASGNNTQFCRLYRQKLVVGVTKVRFKISIEL